MARKGLKQSDVAREINVSRQLLSYVVSGRREMSLQLSSRLESFFSLPDGELFKLQAVDAVKQHKQKLRNRLCDRLVKCNAFWSYDVKSYDAIPDEEIIEKCFMMLDMNDIELMFELYPRKRIRQVWQERMAIQGEYMKMLNVMISMYYFGIKEPEKYLEKIERQHINKLLKQSVYASGIDC
ncbi:MAG: helix-turn-helix transcriptional regulator [Muribaculaceae bacterium]|jgi:transcriptional regulator with XRE-family HTH domain|nr:helix-turn-helix transcriptional regulator [Muribaculaceae bacterium]MBO7164925.1 helix-turn-helix transcriptional regulator [Muribaculaceae bacterium]MBQ1184813.1 helix-turn-helix transcriptional regulator [Muribaculaceae bacterium]MBQ2398447.1 helix-turn-helix transcriptional regulator [Muribaculaceae bacterium]MBQ2440346.1 helix-turn-helix transcriptional regulator [Muribaculaceae bacterium]